MEIDRERICTELQLQDITVIVDRNRERGLREIER